MSIAKQRIIYARGGEMSATKEFHDYIVEWLQKAGEVSTRRMMGEYCVYYKGKLIGDICDNQLFFKPTEAVLRLLPGAERGYPYEGSKSLMVVVDEVENTELMGMVLDQMYEELPMAKKRK